MKEKLLEFIKRYNINTWKIAVFTIFAVILILRFVVQANVFLKPVSFLFNLYSDFLIAQSKLYLSFSDNNLAFDFANNRIINNDTLIIIDRFYFSINQILAIFTIVFVTRSPLLNKTMSFVAGFLILTVYNAVRISLHALYPETITIHNWFFNLILIPRWIIVLGFAWYYWNKFPLPFEFLKQKFGFTDAFIKNTFVKIAGIVALYYIVVIFVFNDIIFLNGSLMVSSILKTSKFFLDSLGYECWINNRLIYGTKASLYMDDACMGINLMFLFASFIVLMPGALKHKIWYIPLGLIAILLLNCLRVILIFINMTRTGAYTMAIEIHDLYTYPVLIFTFFMWVVWMNKFYIPDSHVKNKMQ